jgi:hypothetical protein
MRLLTSFATLRGLPAEQWAPRHRAICVLLVAHLPGLALLGALRGFAAPHIALDLLPVALFAVLAARPSGSQLFRSICAALGLVTASAMTVHTAGGATEAHFHFFVMLPIIGLYLDWRPFALAVGYIVVHHAGFALLFSRTRSIPATRRSSPCSSRPRSTPPSSSPRSSRCSRRSASRRSRRSASTSAPPRSTART